MAETPTPSAPRDALAGMALLGMTLLAVIHVVFPVLPMWLPGVLAWLALLMLLHRLDRLQQLQVSALLSIGLLAGVLGWWSGAVLNPLDALGTNTPLLALLAGVSFLRLVAMPEAGDDERQPRGRTAFLQTLLGTHLFSAVINLSALLIVTDRLSGGRRPDLGVLVPLGRAFSAAAFWSPFFAAMGVALTYAPGASITRLLIQGLPLALAALLYTWGESSGRDSRKLQDYRGYPIHFSALWIPALLVLGVSVLHWLSPVSPVILIVAGLSVGLSVLVRVVRDRATAGQALAAHVRAGLPGMSGELALFLAAGVFSTGIAALFRAFATSVPQLHAGPLLLPGLLVLMVSLALLGIHPVISIALVGVLLADLPLSPDLLGTLFLSAWAIGVSGAPLSGMNLALRGRYGVLGRHILSANWRYILFMLGISSLALLLYARGGMAG